MKLNLLAKRNIAIVSALIAISGAVLFPILASATGTAVFLSGDIMTAGNRSHPTIDWGDPINAAPGDAVEFRVVAQNTVPDTTATNVTVTASLPSSTSSTLMATGTISADNAASVSDNVIVNVTGGTTQAFAYIPGHARVFSSYCPSGCNVGDTVTSSGINVGSLAWGESAQVLFKAYVTNYAAETPTPTPTVTVTPTPTVAPTVTPTPTVTVTPTPTVAPTVTPTPTPGASSGCQSGKIAVISGSNVICMDIVASGGSATATGGAGGAGGSATVNVTQSQSAVVPVAGSGQVKVAGVSQKVTELPKTGLPMAAWAFSGLLPAGLGLKRFGSSGKGLKDSAKYLWQKREFDRV